MPTEKLTSGNTYSALTEKGDLMTFGNTLSVGLDGRFLMADSSSTDGIRWGIPAISTAFTSFVSGTGNADYLTVLDAVNDGQYNLIIVGNTTETGAINVGNPCLVINIQCEITWDLGGFQITGTDALFVSGSGKTIFPNSIVTPNIILSAPLTIGVDKVSLQRLDIQSTSISAIVPSTASQSINDVALEVNVSNGGLDLGTNGSSCANSWIYDDGAATANLLVLTDSNINNVIIRLNSAAGTTTKISCTTSDLSSCQIIGDTNNLFSFESCNVINVEVNTGGVVSITGSNGSYDHLTCLSLILSDDATVSSLFQKNSFSRIKCNDVTCGAIDMTTFTESIIDSFTITTITANVMNSCVISDNIINGDFDLTINNSTVVTWTNTTISGNNIIGRINLSFTSTVNGVEHSVDGVLIQGNIINGTTESILLTSVVNQAADNMSVSGSIISGNSFGQKFDISGAFDATTGSLNMIDCSIVNNVFDAAIVDPLDIELSQLTNCTIGLMTAEGTMDITTFAGMTNTQLTSLVFGDNMTVKTGLLLDSTLSILTTRQTFDMDGTYTNSSLNNVTSDVFGINFANDSTNFSNTNILVQSGSATLTSANNAIHTNLLITDVSASADIKIFDTTENVSLVGTSINRLKSGNDIDVELKTFSTSSIDELTSVNNTNFTSCVDNSTITNINSQNDITINFSDDSSDVTIKELSSDANITFTNTVNNLNHDKFIVEDLQSGDTVKLYDSSEIVQVDNSVYGNIFSENDVSNQSQILNTRITGIDSRNGTIELGLPNFQPQLTDMTDLKCSGNMIIQMGNDCTLSNTNQTGLIATLDIIINQAMSFGNKILNINGAADIVVDVRGSVEDMVIDNVKTADGDFYFDTTTAGATNVNNVILNNINPKFPGGTPKAMFIRSVGTGVVTLNNFQTTNSVTSTFSFNETNANTFVVSKPAFSVNNMTNTIDASGLATAIAIARSSANRYGGGIPGAAEGITSLLSAADDGT